MVCCHWDIPPSKNCNYLWTISFPSVLWHCWLGDRKGIQPVKVGCWFVGGDNLTRALYVLQLQLLSLTISIILSSSKIQNGVILVPANTGPPGKVVVKTDREINQQLPKLLAKFVEFAQSIKIQFNISESISQSVSPRSNHTSCLSNKMSTHLHSPVEHGRLYLVVDFSWDHFV